MNPPYHEAFWGAMSGVASAVVLVQAVAAVVATRSERWTNPYAPGLRTSDRKLKTRAKVLQVIAWGTYMSQVYILFGALISLAREQDMLPPLEVAFFEIPVLLLIPTGLRLAEDISRDLAARAESSPASPNPPASE